MLVVASSPVGNSQAHSHDTDLGTPHQRGSQWDKASFLLTFILCGLGLRYEEGVKGRGWW